MLLINIMLTFVNVTAEYDLLLHDGSNKKLKVSLTADSHFGKFNQRFNTSELVPLPSAANKEEELARLARDFISQYYLTMK